MTDDCNNSRQPIVLCVLDGWGYRTDEEYNAIVPTNTPNFQALWNNNPHSLIETCGIAVGLPQGQMGNSEVGHMNLGAGRIVNQDIRRIDAAIDDNTIKKNKSLINHIQTLKGTGGTCHLLGLVSPGGVHSHQDHLIKIIEILSEEEIPTAIHAFLDGRDTPPSSAAGYLRLFEQQISHIDTAQVVTVSGRYYSMDRDNRWERIEKAYNAIVTATGERSPDVDTALNKSYRAGITDEFVEPAIIGSYMGVEKGDGIIMGNFRADRARQILLALLDPEFEGYPRNTVNNFSTALGLTEYSSHHETFMQTMFPATPLTNIMGSLIANSGKRQLRIAETEKYAHVTFFFNGGQETPFEGEDRVLIPSPKVATYDLKPEMSANELTDRLIEEVFSNKYDFILINYANPDMVGHTGSLKAAKTAIKTVDKCLGRLAKALCDTNGVMLITADHGNAEVMRNFKTGEAHTSHTLNRVPAVLVNAPLGVNKLKNGQLADIAPTLLKLLRIEQPAEMTGTCLIPDVFINPPKPNTCTSG
ncbi:MAG: 2,3-bisphosphoglycerate-independent phosphoglycerate mutase [Pseudomonadota bacterium]|nr:2,3-bisphosphoglycerate-independent phosphoglycerate mutase [Pseudomonadota bacterium]